MKDAIAAAEAAKQQATDNDIAALEEAYDAYLRALQGTATGIIATPAVKPGKATIYYDLMGRRVANPVKGVFITNTGKRVIKYRARTQTTASKGWHFSREVSALIRYELY